MRRIQWVMRIILASLRFRGGRSLMLLTVITMSSSLAASLGMVTFSMERRIADEVRRYGANLLLLPESARMDLGSGTLPFGVMTEPAYLDATAVEQLIPRLRDQVTYHSSHLREPLLLRTVEVPAEGVRFNEVRRMLPWWEPVGRWPETMDDIIVGSDLARRFSLKPGDRLELKGTTGIAHNVTVAGIIMTGSDEDGRLFLDLPLLQTMQGLENRLSLVRIMADSRQVSLASVTAFLEKSLPGTRVREVRQVTRTSASLLKKVQLLMGLVTAVVLAASAASVTGTMSTTVLERGREIGLIKAVGATRWSAVLLFAAEACLLGVAGGVAGCGIGTLIAEMISRSVFSVSIEFIPLAVPISVATGLLIALAGNLGPLLSVYRLDPVQSLRGE